MTGVRGTGQVARAAVFGVASVCLALAAHVAAGGPRPSPVLVALAAALLTRMASGLARRERALGAVAAAVLTAQAALHTAFVVTTHHPAGGGPAGGGPAGGLTPTRAGAAEHLLSALVPGLAMTGGHVLAALCVAVSLHRSERRLWATAALRVAVDRAAAAVTSLTTAVLAHRRSAARLVRLIVGVRARPVEAVRAAAAAGRAGGRRGAGARWHPHLLLLGSDAGWRGPPACRPGSCH